MDARYVATAATSPVVAAAEFDDAIRDPGDMTDAVENFGWDAGAAALLGRWLTEPPALAEAGAPLLSKSIGSVEQDLPPARSLLSAAEDQDLGQVVEPIGTLRAMR